MTTRPNLSQVVDWSRMARWQVEQLAVRSTQARDELARRYAAEARGTTSDPYSDRFQSRLASAWLAGWEGSKPPRRDSNFDAPVLAAHARGRHKRREIEEAIAGKSHDRTSRQSMRARAGHDQ